MARESNAITSKKLLERVRQHLSVYLADPDTGHDWLNVPALLLTTTGRKSCTRTMLPLFYAVDADRYLIVGSVGGGPKHPAWYHNLLANPKVEVQVRHERFAATAHVATDEERPGLWAKAVAVFPSYANYQAKTDRIIPLVILERWHQA